MRPRFWLDSTKSNGVVLRARADWRPWLGERITITAEPKSIRVVLEGISARRESLEVVREELVRALDWAQGRRPEEIMEEGLEAGVPGLGLIEAPQPTRPAPCNRRAV